MNTNIYILAMAAIIGLCSVSCQEQPVEPVIEYKDLSIQHPETYTFDSRFDEGLSSVSYTGQVTRNLLVSDIKAKIDAAKTTANINLKTEVLDLYENGNEASDVSIATTAGSNSTDQTLYTDVTSSSKNLVGKINDDEDVIGYGKNADVLVREWIDALDANITGGATGNDILITADSVDLAQMIHKVLLGAVIYSQGTDNYLDIVLGEDNSGAKDGTSPYSTMEHVWDEAFGYFGAARDYRNYADDDLAGKNGGSPYNDSDASGSIDFNSEYNFGFSTNAGKRDRISSTTGVDPMFTTNCFDAFVAGRTAIANQRDSAEVKIYARSAAQSWERVIAATAVHYINDTKSDLADRMTGGTVASKYDLYKHWSEMRAFTICLQFGGDYQIISDADLADIADLMGESLATEMGAGDDVALQAYSDQLDEAAELFRLIYGFDQDNVDNWRVGQF